eukprot:gene6162-10169_t
MKLFYLLFVVSLITGIITTENVQVVKPGIDGDISVLYNEKIGVITNPTGVNFELKNSIDLLFKNPKIQLTSLFAPEHGIRGDIEPGKRFENYIDPQTRLPVYSLYSKTVTGYPEPYMLKNITTLVFDIQDVGARCYTYISTLVACLKSAKANGVKKVVVLDRPNPIGGDVQGNILEMKHTSFIGIWKLPMKHGMTMGELLLLFNKEMKINHNNVHVVKNQFYDRKPVSQYKKYGWILPSPNLPNFETTLLYPGTVIFESAWNVSLGRGTTIPFSVFGAPYVDAYALLNRVDFYQEKKEYKKYFKGIKIIPTYFTPSSSYHKGSQCSGVAIIITEKEKITHPIELGYTLFKAFMDLYKNRMDIKERSFKILTGTDKIFDLLPIAEVPDIEKLYQKDIEDFKKRRREFLLYQE